MIKIEMPMTLTKEAKAAVLVVNTEKSAVSIVINDTINIIANVVSGMDELVLLIGKKVIIHTDMTVTPYQASKFTTDTAAKQTSGCSKHQKVATGF